MTYYAASEELFQPLAEGDEVPQYRIEVAYPDRPFTNREHEHSCAHAGKFRFRAIENTILRVPPAQVKLTPHITHSREAPMSEKTPFEGATHAVVVRDGEKAAISGYVKVTHWKKDGDHPKVERYPIEKREYKGILRAGPRDNVALRFGDYIVEDEGARVGRAVRQPAAEVRAPERGGAGPGGQGGHGPGGGAGGHAGAR